MLKFGRPRPAFADTAAGQASDLDQQTYDRHAPALYRQAWLTLDDADLAEQVVSDVIVDECVHPAAVSGASGTRPCRMAVAVYRQCQDLAARTRRADMPAGRSPRTFPDCAGLRLLSCEERGAIGLVLFGGLGYREASRELAIPPADMAALLRRILCQLAEQLPGHTRQPAAGAALSGPADVARQAVGQAEGAY